MSAWVPPEFAGHQRFVPPMPQPAIYWMIYHCQDNLLRFPIQRRDASRSDTRINLPIPQDRVDIALDCVDVVLQERASAHLLEVLYGTQEVANN